MRISLRLKTCIMILIIAAVLCAASITGTNIALTNIIKQQFINKAESMTSAISAIIDAPKVALIKEEILKIYNQTDEKDRVSNEDWGSEAHEAYLSLYSRVQEMPEYTQLQDWLRIILTEGKFLYVYVIMPDFEHERMVYVVDGSIEDCCMPGSFDPFTESDHAIIDHPYDGVPADVVVTEEYGWTLALGMPILDENHQIIAYLCADYSMSEIMSIKDHYLLLIGAVLALLALITGFCGILAVNYFVIHPVNILSSASVEFCNENNNNEHHKFENLAIRSKDEIGDLANSMVQMEKDINLHVANLVKTANALIQSREKEAELAEAANIDPLTKVRNKRAFVTEEEHMDEEIKNGTAEFGVAVIDMNNLKTINDTYGHEKGDEAIRDLCNLICNTFKHSPVFRIGGDKFVVILRKFDLKYRDHLISDFYAASELEEAIVPWRGMSAAIGYKVFDPQTDNKFSDVMKVADARMYEKKVQMKKDKGLPMRGRRE